MLGSPTLYTNIYSRGGGQHVTYPLIILSHYPLGHIVDGSQSPIIVTVSTQLLIIASRTLALPCIAYALPNQHTVGFVYDLGGEGGREKGEEKIVQENKTVCGSMALCDMMIA